MKRLLRILTVTVFCVGIFSLTSAFADTISGTAGNGWQTWVAGNADQDAKPYWDGDSSDSGSAANVGNYLTNTGFFSGGSGPGVAFPFWGGTFNSANDGGSPNIGAADPNFFFTKTGTSDDAALKIELAGNEASNVFGWYDTGSPSTLHPIFAGAASDGATATFTPSAAYGFYFTGVDSLTFLTQSGSSPGDNGNQHFAVFQDGSSFWIGMEDTKFSSSDKDYNDMIVKVSSVTSVPEPTTMLLLGLGLIGVAGLRRKFKA
jgi:hypothetical protein